MQAEIKTYADFARPTETDPLRPPGITDHEYAGLRQARRTVRMLRVRERAASLRIKTKKAQHGKSQE